MQLEQLMIVAPGLASLVALAFVAWLAMDVMKHKQGTELMADISKQVQLGAKAFLRQEYAWVFSIVAVIAVVFGLIGKLKPELQINWMTSIAFALGAVASACAGWIGMAIATRANARTANGALEGGQTDGLQRALSVAVSGGAVMGFSVVGISLLGLVICLVAFRDANGQPIMTIKPSGAAS